MKKFFLYPKGTSSFLRVLVFILLPFITFTACNAQPTIPNTSLTNIYWKLVDIKNVPIKRSEKLKEPHFILKSENKFSGFSGCNRFFGSYTTGDNNISFTGIGMTRMMCRENMELERAFTKLFQEATHYKIQGEKLELFNNTQLLASFRAVYF